MDRAHPNTTSRPDHDNTLVESPPPLPTLPFEHATADQLAHLIREGHDTSDLTRLILNTTERAA